MIFLALGASCSWPRRSSSSSSPAPAKCLRGRRLGAEEEEGTCCRLLEPYASGDFSVAVVQANHKLEDQAQVWTSPSASYVGVYDGHGDPDASRFVHRRLFPYLNTDAAAAGGSSFAFEDNFDIMGAEDHFKTSPDGQVWYLYLHKKTGCGFQTKQRYRFGWFSMKLKLVGGDSAGVVTAYYMCSDLGAGPERDEIDFEFLGNRSGQPYTIQTNIYKSGVGGREMRHMLWFDPTADFHTYSILWNPHQLVFYVDRVAIRVYKNTGEGTKTNDFFPIEKPMWVFSSIWNADDWATRGGLEKTDWEKAPFVSTYKDFTADACRWEDPYPACVATTTKNWWDQYGAWVLSADQQEDFGWVGRNLVIYDYCKDTDRYPKLPPECSL